MVEAALRRIKNRGALPHGHQEHAVASQPSGSTWRGRVRGRNAYR